jgi:DNA-binding transcriptional LysR family regulator
VADTPIKRDHWLGIELRHLAALAAIAEEHSFRGAAERLGYVQSAVSRQIAHLEQLTESRLIERASGPKPVYLTEAGESLLAWAQEILAIIDAAKSEVDGSEPRSTEEVRIGLSDGVATRIVAAALPVFARRYPGVRVNASETLSDAALFDLLRRGRVDLAVAHLPVEPDSFASCELLRVPWALVVPAGTEITSDGTRPTLGQIARLPLLGLKSQGSEPWSELRFHTRIAPQIVFRCEAAHTAQALAGAGVGAALIPRLAVQEGDPRTTVIELGDLLRPATIGFVWHRERTLPSGTVQFRELVRQVCSVIERQPSSPTHFTREEASTSLAVEVNVAMGQS